MSATGTRFSFDTVFDEDGAIVRAAARQKTSFSPDEVETIRQTAFAQGTQNAEAAANTALSNALNGIAKLAAQLLRRQDQELAEIRAEASRLALAAARKIAGAALARYPLDVIEPAVAAALHDFHAEARLVVRVSPAMVGPMQARLPDLIAADGFPGRAVVAGDPAIRDADSRIEWADGGAERDTDKIFASLEAEIARWHAAETAQLNPDAQTTE